MKGLRVLGLLVTLAVSAKADVLEVPADFATIQAAIDASAPGDTIRVAPGTYHEAVDFSSHSKLRLESTDGAGVTIIDGGGANITVDAGPSSSGITVSGFTITGGTVGGRAVMQGVKLNKFIDCTFVGNGATGLSAEAHNLYTAGITGCRFLGNGGIGAVLFIEDPIEFFFGATLHVDSCVFTGGDRLVFDFSFQWSSPAPPLPASVTQCSFDGAGCQVVSDGTDLIVNSCIVRGVVNPFLISGTLEVAESDVQGGWPGPGNFDADPDWVDPAGGDYGLSPGSPCINSGSAALPLDADGTQADRGGVPFESWHDLGGGIGALAGPATLAGFGPVPFSHALQLQVTDGPPSASVYVLLGAAPLGLPFQGGTLWPLPQLLVGPIPTNLAGSCSLAGVPGPALPVGFHFWSQVLWPDAGAPGKFAASNGLRYTQP